MKNFVISFAIILFAVNAKADCKAQIQDYINEIKLTPEERAIEVGFFGGFSTVVALSNPVAGIAIGTAIAGVELWNKSVEWRLKKSIHIIDDAYNYHEKREATKRLSQTLRRVNRNIRKLARKYKIDAWKGKTVSMEEMVLDLIAYNEAGERCIMTPRRMGKTL